ncbi:ATP-binding protein [Sporosarcina sp. E16_8]|uniref:two-component system sensor histidine kinase NtrB n=1 Tax=Sporosarcina sp. E16_8 TaxID=2789295 RepID=UPI001A91424A|nr:ATP-binding protein [Sporosarcina sp. E16_8]MBO0585970.1 PAS domain S-box protein [Sporosarcina sp. E16_8]
MKNSTVVHSRNMFIILFFVPSVIVHLFMSYYLGFSSEMIAALFGLFIVTVLFVFYKSGMNSLTFRIPLIIGYILYIFITNLLNPDLVQLFYLIFPVALVAVYNITWLNVLITLITGIEVFVLFYLFSPIYRSVDEAQLLPNIAFIFSMAVVLCLLYTFRITPFWNTIFKENKKMNVLLTSKECYLDLFIEHSEDAIVMFDLDQNIVAMNPAFEKMYGWKREECMGRAPRLFPSSEDSIIAERTQNLLDGKSFHFLRTKEMRKDGTIFNAELTLAPIYDVDKKLVATSFIARDITLKLQAEQFQIDTEKLKAIGEIAASVAHEVRNPMTAISGFVQMMNNDPANQYRAYTEIMYNEINRVDLIVSEFLALAKPNLKKCTEFYIEKSLLDVLSIFETEFITRSIFCDVRIPKNNAIIKGNEDGMKQVFINILKNACEALVKNGVITVVVTFQDDTVSIFISDDGPGMDPETIDNLFEPFYTTKTEGTGLGMLITKKIIVDQGGTITVNSKINHGTETTIILPLNK